MVGHFGFNVRFVVGGFGLGALGLRSLHAMKPKDLAVFIIMCMYIQVHVYCIHICIYIYISTCQFLFKITAGRIWVRVTPGIGSVFLIHPTGQKKARKKTAFS